MDIQDFAREMVKEAVIGPIMDLSLAGIPSMIGYGIGAASAPKGKRQARSRVESSDVNLVERLSKYAIIPGYTGYRWGKHHAASDYLKRDRESR